MNVRPERDGIIIWLSVLSCAILAILVYMLAEVDDMLVFICGVIILVDGVGSMMIPGNFHNLAYDGERMFRAAIGFILAVHGV